MFDITKYFNHLISFLCILFMVASSVKNDKPKFQAEYCGQEPPGLIPELFASDIISGKFNLHGFPTFSPNGKEIYWPVLPPKILFMKYENNSWTNPAEASFSESNSQAPCFSPDGNKIFYQVTRNGGYGNLDIWYVEKVGIGLSHPKNIGQPINSSKLESQPSFTKEGTIYFTGELEGVLANRGIYRARYANGKEYIFNSGIIRKLDSNDKLIIEIRKIESIEVLHDMPAFDKPSESTIATCLRNWQLGSVLTNDHENKKILNKALITTNQSDYIFMVLDNFCYCRKFRYDTHNKGMAVSRGDIRLMVNRNEFTSYMPEDHINSASQKLLIDESKFDPTKCFFDTGVIYWSLKKYYNDKIELHGCDGMTYPYYLPKSKNSKVEWFRSL